MTGKTEYKQQKNNCYERRRRKRSITDKIKTYEDACVVLGIEPDDEEVLTNLGFTGDEIAYRKLKTITKALNEGWTPDWGNTKQYKYWAYFATDCAGSGCGWSPTHIAASVANASCGSRLCYKTAELAMYAGTQFTNLYSELILFR